MDIKIFRRAKKFRGATTTTPLTIGINFKFPGGEGQIKIKASPTRLPK